MYIYAGRSVGKLYVCNSAATVTQPQFYEGIPGQIEVTDLDIQFIIDWRYEDYPPLDHGKGRFKVWLYRLTENGWEEVDYDEKNGGNNKDSDTWTGTLHVEHRMQNKHEVYGLKMWCRLRLVTIGGQENEDFRSFTCVQSENYLGDFNLEFIPLHIIYCPPGQDMTNSLYLSEDVGTRITVGNTSGFRSLEGGHAGASNLGLNAGGIGIQESQGVSEQSQNCMELRFFRNILITADNQKAIGRAYWGPLSDIFVVMVNPRFSAVQHLDSIFYENTGCDQIIFIPAHKLLRPGDDPIANSIPLETRKYLLEQDPFIINLDLFFPDDSGIDLARAANPYADPSGDDRAVSIALWHISTGIEMKYVVGDIIRLRNQIGKTMEWKTRIHGNVEVLSAIGGEAGQEYEVGIHWSKEAEIQETKSASCSLVRNQNESDLSPIKIYYDNNFSTFMFRKIRIGRPERTPFQDIKNLPDLTPDLISELIIDFAPELGIDKEIHPKGVLNLDLPDLGIPEVFPDIPKAKLRKLYKKLETLIIPNKSLKGSAIDATKAPILFENIELLKREKVFYQSETDINGDFRFDNILAGKYTVRIGNKSKNVNIGKKNDYSNPKELNIRNVKHIIDTKTIPRWKFMQLFDIGSEEMNLITSNIRKYNSISKIAEMKGLSRKEEKSLKKRVQWVGE